MALHAQIDAGSADFWNEADGPEYAYASVTVLYWDDECTLENPTEEDYDAAEAAGMYFHCTGFIDLANGLVIDADGTPLGLCEEHAARIAWRDCADEIHSITNNLRDYVLNY